MPPTEKINKVWASSPRLNTNELITLPSGQTAEVQRIGLEGIMSSGLLGEADSLTAFVGKQHVHRVRGGKGVPDGDVVDAKSIMRDPKTLQKIVFLVDRMTPLVVVNPVVHLHFEFTDNIPGNEPETRMIPPSDRLCGVCGDFADEHDEGMDHTYESAIYTDMIGLEDKMYLFQWALGGTRDLERFRSESAEAMGNVVDIQEVQPTAERPHARERRPRRR